MAKELEESDSLMLLGAGPKGAQPLVLWKNRQYVANRRRYVGGALQLRPVGLPPDSAAARALTVPNDPAAADRAFTALVQTDAQLVEEFDRGERLRMETGAHRGH